MIAGIICGISFQIFQFVYLNSQIWLSKYNAIYGGFAFLPLLLIWMQISWLIFLFGVLLSFSMQTADYGDEESIDKISTQYSDFIILIVSCVVVQRFEKGLPPLSLQKISSLYGIPIRIVNIALKKLLDTGIFIEVFNKKEKALAYQPAFDISSFSVGELLNRVGENGTGEEKFKVNKTDKYKLQWDTIVAARNDMYDATRNILVKDLKIEQPN